MTIPYWGTVLCGLCGTETEFTGILSTHSIGSSDLDTRSPAMHGIVLAAQVQRCPGCGYCSSDVSVAQPEAQTVIARQEYQGQLNDLTYPKLATSFLCKAILDGESKDFSTATWALICAAWVCDDADHLEQAKVCRLKAADMLVLAEEHNQKVADQDRMSVAILVDLLRRSEQVNQAQKVITARRESIADDLIKRILDYQSELLNKNDFSRHSMSEVRSPLKKSGPNYDDGSDGEGVSDANEQRQVEVEKHSERVDSDLNKDTNDEIIWDFDIRDLTWEDYQREKKHEEFLAYVQKFRDVLRKDGIDAAGAYLEKEIKARNKPIQHEQEKLFDWGGARFLLATFIIAIVGIGLGSEGSPIEPPLSFLFAIPGAFAAVFAFLLTVTAVWVYAPVLIERSPAPTRPLLAPVIVAIWASIPIWIYYLNHDAPFSLYGLLHYFEFRGLLVAKLFVVGIIASLLGHKYVTPRN